MLRIWLLGVMVGASIVLAGCTIQPIQPVGPVTPAVTPEVTPTPDAASAPTPAEHAAMWVRNVIAEKTQLPLDQITVVLVEEVEWPDACLGVYNADEMCAAVITPGFRVVVETPDGDYVVHTDAEGRSLRIASAPEAAVGDVLIEWQLTEETCRHAVIGRDGVAVGPCGGVQEPGILANPDRAEELIDLVTTFAPFQAETAAGVVTFHGEGTHAAVPAEQRMIAEWARLVAAEAEYGRSGAAWRLALAWHREGGIMGHCDALTVYVTGQTYAASCRQDPPATIAQRRLRANELARIFRWVDRVAPWEYSEGDLRPADGMLTTMIFLGRGGDAAASSDKQLALALAEQLWADMTQ